MLEGGWRRICEFGNGKRWSWLVVFFVSRKQGMDRDSYHAVHASVGFLHAEGSSQRLVDSVAVACCSNSLTPR